MEETKYCHEQAGPQAIMADAILQRELTTYLNFSLPLCVILSSPGKLPWFYSHYTQLYSMNSGPDNKYLWIDYLEENNSTAEVLEWINLDLDVLMDNPDIISFMKEKIDNKYSVMLFLDEFCLTDRRGFNNWHYPLQAFFYGYDDKESALMSIGFLKNMEFGYLKQSYNDVRLALSELVKRIDSFPNWVKHSHTALLKVKCPNEEYKFDQSKFIKKLGDYTFSIGDSSQLRLEIKDERGDHATYGINTHDDVVRRLNSLLEGKHLIDYRAVHILTEHKEMLHKKICYSASKFQCESVLGEKIDEYASITKKYKVLAAAYKRYAFLDSERQTIYGPLKNKEFIIKAINTIVSEKEHEKKVLTDIYEYLESRLRLAAD